MRPITYLPPLDMDRKGTKGWVQAWFWPESPWRLHFLQTERCPLAHTLTWSRTGDNDFQLWSWAGTCPAPKAGELARVHQSHTWALLRCKMLEPCSSEAEKLRGGPAPRVGLEATFVSAPGTNRVRSLFPTRGLKYFLVRGEQFYSNLGTHQGENSAGTVILENRPCRA